MRYLTEQDIRQSVNWPELLDAIEEAYRLFTDGQCRMAERTTAARGGTTLLMMPCFAGEWVSTKILASCPDNPARGLPALSGVVLLNRAEDGQPEAILDGATVTALRTGAVGGLAARHLAWPGTGKVGLVGCGVQGLHLLACACAVGQVETVYLRQSPGRDLEPYLRRIREMTAPATPALVLCPDADTVLARSQLVFTATPARAPLFSDDPALFRGKCVVAVGSWQPEMRELPDGIWQAAEEVYVELPYAMEESGDLSQPLSAGLLTEDRVRLFGTFLRDGGTPRGETRLFKSVGMGVFDTLAAAAILRAAEGKGLGTVLP